MAKANAPAVPVEPAKPVTPVEPGPGVLSAERDGALLVITVCPQYLNGCGCGGNLHRVLRYGAEAPEGDARTAEEWAASCADEALRLVAAEGSRRAAPPPRSSMVALVGRRLKP